MEKTYTVGKHAFKQGELLLGQARNVVRLIRQLDLEARGDDVMSLVDQMFDSGLVDEFMDLILVGDQPKQPASEWMPLEVAIEVVQDFLSLNGGLFKKLSSVLPNSLNQETMTPSQNSMTKQETNSPSMKT